MPAAVNTTSALSPMLGFPLAGSQPKKGHKARGTTPPPNLNSDFDADSFYAVKLPLLTAAKGSKESSSSPLRLMHSKSTSPNKSRSALSPVDGGSVDLESNSDVGKALEGLKKEHSKLVFDVQCKLGELAQLEEDFAEALQRTEAVSEDQPLVVSSNQFTEEATERQQDLQVQLDWQEMMRRVYLQIIKRLEAETHAFSLALNARRGMIEAKDSELSVKELERKHADREAEMAAEKLAETEDSCERGSAERERLLAERKRAQVKAAEDLKMAKKKASEEEAKRKAKIQADMEEKKRSMMASVMADAALEEKRERRQKQFEHIFKITGASGSEDLINAFGSTEERAVALTERKDEVELNVQKVQKDVEVWKEMLLKEKLGIASGSGHKELDEYETKLSTATHDLQRYGEQLNRLNVMFAGVAEGFAMLRQKMALATGSLMPSAPLLNEITPIMEEAVEETGTDGAGESSGPPQPLAQQPDGSEAVEQMLAAFEAGMDKIASDTGMDFSTLSDKPLSPNHPQAGGSNASPSVFASPRRLRRLLDAPVPATPITPGLGSMVDASSYDEGSAQSRPASRTAMKQTSANLIKKEEKKHSRRKLANK
mmetsp:Transcript_15060/g.49389  ORF Transcript_15060/g.49389 Transcript_15060/m.49389 type:complete len:601 (+) Transcript_15060:53-1855(+)|eukprot:CAMPEP_0170140932 /NCGR_PEP_ID=MMETSP0033_2-20121228/6680_1 /TAXON_ID=195969 /ORGANISM="Dolichomastix tenuilepis, Strain CCMP3274" /LENGTH=600 /DNA_ID=CAMNT_0010377171 /DNA_START=53 /DNA_END=1855 /DNA_ORIENTATION=-